MRQSGISHAILMGLLVGCSSSTAPNLSLNGTWHVALGALNNGTVLPTSFDVKVRQTGNSYLVTMPTLIWSEGAISVTFDSGPTLEGFTDSTKAGYLPGFTDSTKAGFIEFAHAPHAGLCEYVSIFGTKNAGLDTLSGALIEIENNDTITGGCPLPTLGGPATIHK